MTDKTQPTAHAEITAPISADLRGIDDAGAQPDVLRKPNRECFDAFMKAAEDAGVTHMQQWVEDSGYQCADCKTPLKQGYDCGACGSFEAEEIEGAALAAAPAQAEVSQDHFAPAQEHATQLAGQGHTPERQRMTAGRASFFMERFLKEEKLLGPNEQAALHFVIDMLAAPAQAQEDARDADGWYLQDTRSYVGNDVVWWAKDSNGYTTDVSKAHVFTREEAFKQAAMRGVDRAWPKEYIDGKTRPAVDMQYIKHEEAIAARAAQGGAA